LALKTKLLTTARENTSYKAAMNMQGYYVLLLSNAKHINLDAKAKPIKN
jgi:hypothetical protein